MSTKARTGHEELGYRGFKRRREHLYDLEIVDEPQCSIYIGKVLHSEIAVIEIANDYVANAIVTQ